MSLNGGEKTVSLPSHVEHQLADNLFFVITRAYLNQGREVAEKINASPQNSAFESGTLQDSQCSMTFSELDSKITEHFS